MQDVGLCEDELDLLKERSLRGSVEDGNLRYVSTHADEREGI